MDDYLIKVEFVFLKLILWIFELLDRKIFTWMGLKFICHWGIDDLVEVAQSRGCRAEEAKDEKENQKGKKELRSWEPTMKRKEERRELFLGGLEAHLLLSFPPFLSVPSSLIVILFSRRWGAGLHKSREKELEERRKENWVSTGCSSVA